MKSIKFKICSALAILAFGLCLPLPPARAATYYVSTSEGRSGNSGTSAQEPWNSLTNVYLHNHRLQPYFAPGDSILLRAGDGFDGPLILEISGTQELPITIDRYGNGANPIVYGDHNYATNWTPVPGHPGIYQQFLGPFAALSKVYDLNGVRYSNLVYGTNVSIDAWLNKFSTNNWGAYPTPAPCTVYLSVSGSNQPPSMHLMESGTVGCGSYTVIQNLDVRNGGGAGISPSGVGITVRNNSVRDTTGSGISLFKCISSVVASNTVAYSANTSIYIINGGSNWVHHNTCSYSGGSLGPGATRGMFLMTNCFVVPIDQSGVGLDASTNNIVEYNSFSNINDACFDYFFEANSEVRFNYAFHTKGAASPSGTGLSLHHNVFNLDVAGGGINASHAFNFTDSQIARDTGPVLVYNNVIYNCTGYGLYAGAASSTNVIFRNNIVVATSNVTGLAKLATGVNSDYNLYYMLGMNNQGAPLWSWNSGGWLRSLGDFRAASGQDAHSLYADPRFVSTRPVVAADFQLRGISPGINVGQNLRNTGLLMPAQQYQDYLGALVPEGAGPDIGAYERKLDRPAAPTNPLFKP